MMVLLTMLTRRRRWRSRQPLEFLRWMGRYERARKWHRTHCQVPALVISNGQQMAFEVLGGVESAYLHAWHAFLWITFLHVSCSHIMALRNVLFSGMMPNSTAPPCVQRFVNVCQGDRVLLLSSQCRLQTSEQQKLVLATVLDRVQLKCPFPRGLGAGLHYAT